MDSKILIKNKLLSLMEDENMSNAEFSRRLAAISESDNLTPNHINNWLNDDTRGVPIKYYSYIAILFKIDEDYLKYDKYNVVKNAKSIHYNVKIKHQELLDKISNSNKELDMNFKNDIEKIINHTKEYTSKQNNHIKSILALENEEVKIESFLKADLNMVTNSDNILLQEEKQRLNDIYNSLNDAVENMDSNKIYEAAKKLSYADLILRDEEIMLNDSINFYKDLNEVKRLTEVFSEEFNKIDKLSSEINKYGLHIYNLKSNKEEDSKNRRILKSLFDEISEICNTTCNVLDAFNVINVRDYFTKLYNHYNISFDGPYKEYLLKDIIDINELLEQNTNNTYKDIIDVVYNSAFDSKYLENYIYKTIEKIKSIPKKINPILIEMKKLYKI